jgi:hypothetical protein
VITFNKDGKRRAQEQKLQDRFEEDRSARERTMMDIRESQNRIGRAAGYGQDDAEEGIGGDAAGGGGARGRFKTAEQQAARKSARSRYQHEATASDDEVEDEIDDNLDEIHDAVKRMKALGMAMGQEVDNQIGRIGRIETKTDSLDMRVVRNTERVRPCSDVHRRITQADSHTAQEDQVSVMCMGYSVAPSLVLYDILGYHTACLDLQKLAWGISVLK